MNAEKSNASVTHQGITTGNAREAALDGCQRGWFIGHFVDPAFGLRSTPDVEVKWGEHRPDDARTEPGVSPVATTLTLLVRGSFLLEFPELGRSYHLRHPGDYVIFGPGIAHTWKVLEESTVLTVRWPSAENGK